MSNKFEKGEILVLTKLVEYSDNGIISKRVLENTSGNITLFSFDKDQKLSEHSAPFDAFIQVLEGKVKISIGGKPNNLGAGDSIIMPANIPHAVFALERFKMLLTMVKGNQTM
jgi:quercetin dioxygenase-like cupin family protein